MAAKRWNNKMSGPGRKCLLTMAGLLIAAGVSMTANAAGIDLIREKNGGARNSDTQVFLGVSKEVPKDVSFEVPLFYTMVIASDDPAENGKGRFNQVMRPANYRIENKTYQVVDGEKTAYLTELAVVNMRVQSVKGSTWSLVDAVPADAGENDKVMKVSIGGVPLPAITAGDVRTVRDANLKQDGSIFCVKKEDGSFAYRLLGNQGSQERALDLDVQVDISPKYKPKEIIEKPEVGDHNQKERAFTQAQFKVMYTLSPLDVYGNPIASYDRIWVDQNYDGPGPETAETLPPAGNP